MKIFKPVYTIKVGGIDADICGFDSGAIQMASDLLKLRGGGIIQLSEGEFRMNGPVRIYSNIHIVGKGKDTILKKKDGFKSKFLTDVDYCVKDAELEDTSGFAVGDGILILDDKNNNGWTTSTSKIIGKEGNKIYFDRYTNIDYQRIENGMITNACSIIEGIKVENIKISNLAIDGSKSTNYKMDGCRGGAIYLHKAKFCEIENVTVSNFFGDGISWQTTENITLRNTETFGCTGFGLHPGTGSYTSIVEECLSHDNGRDGIYVCWRVKNSIFRNNIFCKNQESGVCIGHKDTDNIFENNKILENGKAGINVRLEPLGSEANNNIFRKNIIVNNGNEIGGYGFLFEMSVSGNIIEENIIRDTGKGVQLVAIETGGECSWLTLKRNKI